MIWISDIPEPSGIFQLLLESQEEAKGGAAGGGVAAARENALWDQLVKWALHCQVMPNINHRGFRNWVQVKDQCFGIVLRHFKELYLYNKRVYQFFKVF